MRRGRRGGSRGLEFGGSGEDSFVAVVVTKLTGALLFILLLAMVIMALLPKAMDVSDASDAKKTEELAIVSGEALPDAIVGRPYSLALAARGGSGDLSWSVLEDLPEGLKLDPTSGVISGVPSKATSAPTALSIRVADERNSVGKQVALTIYKPEIPLTLPSAWRPSVAAVPWRLGSNRALGF